MGYKTIVKWEHDGPEVVRVLDNSRDNIILLAVLRVHAWAAVGAVGVLLLGYALSLVIA